MLVLFGGAALTPARARRLLSRLQASNPEVSGLSAHHVHLVDVAADLSVAERMTLEALLAYGFDPGLTVPAVTGARRWVVPRLGTQSPWSSKATDIARGCGLAAVRRIERGVQYVFAGTIADETALRADVHDRMTESVLNEPSEAAALFAPSAPRPLRTIPLGNDGPAALARANDALGLALSSDEQHYLVASYTALGRDPTDVELMMFAQANSEHCRHKIFNASFRVDGTPMPDALFTMIRRSTEASPDGVLSAYADNAAVFAGATAGRFFVDPETGTYRTMTEPIDVLVKVETHNHPTGISPFPGAATGSGGEIRDEGATGRGSKPKAGLVGFCVSDLHLPGCPRPWEVARGHAPRMASPLDIMLEGPLGGAAFNNEFGRPALLGIFRTFELEVPGDDGPAEVRGYHKPIMLAGGLGNIRRGHVAKGTIEVGAPVVVLGGPAMLIGLGGGAASSVGAGASDEALDFASVQRDNPEMQRRCQEVIDRCWALGDQNPIVAIHDVGAGGLSNALPELMHDSGRGGHFDLRQIPSAEVGMSPLELWCNEAQERYVIGLDPARRATFEAIATRERCPFAVVGTATADGRLRVDGDDAEERPIDVPLDLVLGRPPRMERDAVTPAPVRHAFRPDEMRRAGTLEVADALDRVLRLPTVGDKTFLVTIGDRTVTGLVARDQMVGPHQVPVADVAVTFSAFDGTCGEAMAIGERPPVALIDAAASARMAVGEALTNLVAADVADTGDVRLSANWMAAAGAPGEDARLYAAVRAVGVELAPALGIAIPVGKDSLSMRARWRDEDGRDQAVTAPLSLVVTAFASVADVRLTLTPELERRDDTELWALELGSHRRLGGSALAQVYGQLGDEAPDVDDPARLRGFVAAVAALRRDGVARAYHDRSDGGLVVTLLEMAFATGCGMEIDLAETPPAAALAALFCEELGAVVQISREDTGRLHSLAAHHGLVATRVGRPRFDGNAQVTVTVGGTRLYEAPRCELRAAWSETTHVLQRLRDDPDCADEEHAVRLDDDAPGLAARATFDLDATTFVGAAGERPRVAILREQGVNGQVEMAAAFDRAGFEAVDVHMSDLSSQRQRLNGFVGLVACGGFSFGDVLGAGAGWAKSILFHEPMKRAFADFFARPDTFALGVCNGCQMFAHLRELIHGAAAWPHFVANRSERFEARLSLVRIEPSPSIFFRDMEGSVLPVAVAHGEGRADWSEAKHAVELEAARLVGARYVHPRGEVATTYPYNPNGSPGGITAVTTPDGRVTAMMPHPERGFRAHQLSWRPAEWASDGPWMRMFRNARAFVG
ncbi:MAG: phosphoribosylformylglycinamidine synthase [Myxococcota bacterium]